MSSIAPPSHTRSANTSDDWITPVMFRDKLGPFDLDPCASVTQPWPMASRSFTIEDHGLMRDWEHDFVWMNPPYGKALGAWLNRLALHNHGIAFVFARTDTRAFFEGVWRHASSLLFVRGRVTFHRPDGSLSPLGHNSGGPSVLIGYGPEADLRLAAADDLGAFVWNAKGRAV